MNVAITVSELAPNEALEATIQILARSRVGRIIGLLVLVGLIGGSLQLTPARDPRWSAWIWFYPLGFGAFIVAVSYYGLRARSKRGPFHFDFTDAGLGMRFPAFTGVREWSGFHRTVETRHTFLLYVHPGMAHIIPKRSFASADDLAAVRSLIREKLGTRARLT